MFSAKVIKDSVNPFNGVRLITMELTYPRFIHAEFMTHRMFSRNAASSRAIPTRKMIKMVDENPAMPIFWGKNKRGMSADIEIGDKGIADAIWISAKDEAVRSARALYEIGAHKQIVNRILEPWKFITVICTATQWSNFFALRRHEDAQPEIHHLANLMWDAQQASQPKEELWHIPYIQEDEEDLELDVKLRVATARCARVSYLTHDGKRSIEKDLELHQRLMTGSGHGHWSPFEHCAKAVGDMASYGNFVGWKQYRKMHDGECQ